MGQKTSQHMTVENAVDRLYQVCNEIHEAGFILTGAVFAVKPQGKLPKCEATKTITNDRRVGILRLLPPASTKPLPIPQAPAGIAALSAWPPPPLPPALSVDDAAVVVAAAGPLIKKLPATGTGDICATCGGVSFTRKGNCLYCDECGDSVGGCS